MFVPDCLHAAGSLGCLLPMGCQNRTMTPADPPLLPLPLLPLLPPFLQTSCSSTGAACSASCGAAGCWRRSEFRCWTAWALTGAAQTLSPE